MLNKIKDNQTEKSASLQVDNKTGTSAAPLPQEIRTEKRIHLNPRTLFADFGWILLIIIILLLRSGLRSEQHFVEKYMTGGLFQVVSRPISWVTSILSISLSETLLLFGVFAVINRLVRLLAAAVRRLRHQEKGSTGEKANTATALSTANNSAAVNNGSAANNQPSGFYRRRARFAAWGAAILFLMFFLLHGVNYLRLPVSKSFDLKVQPRKISELKTVSLALAAEAAATRELCLEDENGVFKLSKGIGGTLNETSNGFEAAATEYPQLTGGKVRPKAVMLSHLWSYTGISGIYVPFLVEANINIDQSPFLIPDSAAHEVAHTRGYAREDEASFIAFLANIYHPNPDFRYSALVASYIRFSNALYAQDYEAYKEVSQQVTAPMARDLNANYEYWQQFAGPVTEVSTQINNIYLKSNDQTDGVHSYGRMIDLVLAYWEKTDGSLRP